MMDTYTRKRANVCLKHSWLLVLIFLVAGLLISCSKQEIQEQTLAVEPPEQTTVSEDNSVAADADVLNTAEVMVIDTTVCQLHFPISYGDYMSHREVIQDHVVLEVFYMVYEEIQMELFRIQFDSQETDHDIGLIETESGNLYVTVSVCEYAEDDFENQETYELYQSIIGCIDTVLGSIQTDSRFSKKDEIQVNVSDNTLRYWSIELPENMVWEEMEGEESYRVAFFGNIKNQKIKLYEVAIGGSELSSHLGYYKIESQYSPVSIESFDLPSTEGWNEGEITELYIMMETINSVISAIVADENYSTEIPG